MNITLNTILNAVVNSPYPIMWRIPYKVPVIPLLGEIKYCNSYEEVDIRPYAQKALEHYNKEYKELNDKYCKLLNEFEEYKKGKAEYNKFLDFKRRY